MQRSQVINLAAGPSQLPQPVLEQAALGLLNYEGTGIGITELSHRSSEFKNLTNSLEASIRDILDVPDTHVILFNQGGGCGQFSAVVLNLLAVHYTRYPNLKPEDRVMDYVITGSWSKKAAEEAGQLSALGSARVNVVVDARKHSQSGKSFQGVPMSDAWKFSKSPAFVYYCENETVDGVQFSDDLSSPSAFPFQHLPSVDGETVPLIGDHSSSFLSRQIPNLAQHALIYAGAQKNVGPAGLTILIVRKDLLVDTVAATKYHGAPPVPTTMSYKVLADAGSLYNTPPMFSMYVSLLAVKYYISNGGLSALRSHNDAKQKKVYQVVDEGVAAGFFVAKVEPGSRSWMNVTFTLTDPSLEKAFVQAAEEKGLRGIKGHRSVGGIRFSLYNAVSEPQVDTVVAFTRAFIQAQTPASAN